MAKKKPADEVDRDEAKRFQIVIDADLVRKVRFLAADANVSPTNWINNEIRRVVQLKWPDILRELQELKDVPD